MLRFLGRALAFGLASCVLDPAFFGARAGGLLPRSYWTQRQAVVLRIDWDLGCRIREVRVLANHASPAAAESLIGVVRQWGSLYPDWGVSSREYDVVAFALDRAAPARGDSAARLPEAVRTAFLREPLRSWSGRLREFDPEFGVDDFSREVVGSMRALPSAPRDSVSKWWRAQEALGLLHRSPDGRWILDPFVGTEVIAGRLGRDADLGYGIYDTATGAYLDYEVWFGANIITASWLDATTFVLTLVEPVDWDPRASVPVPMILVGDMKSRTITRFMGAPIATADLRGLRARLRAYRQSLYPRVRLD